MQRRPDTIRWRAKDKRGNWPKLKGSRHTCLVEQIDVTDPEIGAFFDRQSHETLEVVLALRNVVRRTIPKADETLLWGGLSYHRPKVGGRVKGSICQICVKAGKVRLDFIHGIRLEDPLGFLKGDRVSKRFIPIATVAQAERPEIAALIRKAAALDPTEWSSK